MQRITNQLKRQYYLYDGEFEHGPYTLEELRSKNLTANSLIWHSRLKEWSTVADVPEVAAQLNSPQHSHTETDPYSRASSSAFANGASPGRENVRTPIKKTHRLFITGGGLAVVIVIVIWVVGVSC